jgi:hypothetical protein
VILYIHGELERTGEEATVVFFKKSRTPSELTIENKKVPVWLMLVAVP